MAVDGGTADAANRPVARRIRREYEEDSSFGPLLILAPERHGPDPPLERLNSKADRLSSCPLLGTLKWVAPFAGPDGKTVDRQ